MCHHRRRARSGSRPVGSVALLLLAAAVSSCGLCRNERVAEYPSTDGTAKVVVFERDCGATTPFSAQASLVPVGVDAPFGIGNLFAADDNHGIAPDGPGGGPELRVCWIDAVHLELAYHVNARVSRAETSLGLVRVSCTTFK